jgi:hypothetical protein
MLLLMLLYADDDARICIDVIGGWIILPAEVHLSLLMSAARRF